MHKLLICLLFLVIAGEAYTAETGASGQELQTAEVTVRSLRVRTDSGGQGAIRGHVWKGQVYVVINDEEDWAEIWYDHKTGWVEKKFIQTINNQSLGQVTAPVSIRSGYGRNFGRVGWVPKDSKWALIATQKQWVKIYFAGSEKWLNEKYIVQLGDQPLPQSNVEIHGLYPPSLRKPSSHNIKVTTPVLYVRKGAGTIYDFRGLVLQDQVYATLSTQGPWQEIWFDHKTGWVHGDYVEKVDNKNSGKITATQLRVRTGPSNKAQRIGLTPNQSSWIVSGVSGDWWRIYYAGTEKWVHKKYLTLKMPPSVPEIRIEEAQEIAMISAISSETTFKKNNEKTAVISTIALSESTSASQTRLDQLLASISEIDFAQAPLNEENNIDINSIMAPHIEMTSLLKNSKPRKGELSEIQNIDLSLQKVIPAKELLVDIAVESNEEAIQLREALDLNPESISSQNQLISLYLKQKQPEKAITFLSQQLIRNPGNIDASLNLSKLLQKQGNNTDALDVLYASLNRISLSGRVALSEELTSDVKAGQSTLTTKSDAEFISDEFGLLGTSFLKEKDFSKALSTFQTLHSLTPSYGKINYYLGASRNGLEQYKQAVKDFITQFGKTSTLIENILAFSEALVHTNDTPNMEKMLAVLTALTEEGNTSQNLDLFKHHINALEIALSASYQRLLKKRTDLSLALTKSLTYQTIQPGKEINLNLSVANISDVNSPGFRVTYQLNNFGQKVYDFEDSNQFQGIVVGGDPVHWSIKLPTPPNIIFGKYRVVVNMELMDNTLDRNSRNNYLQSKFIYYYLPPDVALVNFQNQILNRFRTGEKIRSQVIWRNLGGTTSRNNQLKIQLINTKNPKDTLLLFEKLIPEIKALSTLDSISEILTIPELKPKTSYKLEATLVSKGKIKDINPRNNRITSSRNYELSTQEEYFTPIAFLYPDYAFPSKQIQWRIQFKNHTSEPLKGLQADLYMEDSKGEKFSLGTQLFDLSPSEKSTVNPGTVSKNWIEGNSAFPSVPLGSYRVFADIIWKSSQGKNIQQRIYSNTPVTYQLTKPVFESILADSDALFPGENFSFQLVLQNKGQSQSSSEDLELFLAGKKQISLGKIEIPSLSPREEAYVLPYTIKVPDDIAGVYRLFLERKAAGQNEPERLSLPKLIRVAAVRVLAPIAMETYHINTVPVFQWEGKTGFQYRVRFSTDPNFQEGQRLFQIPFGAWTSDTQMKPKQGEWQLIWMLSSNGTRPLYWRLEIQNAEGEQIPSITRLLKLLTAQNQS